MKGVIPYGIPTIGAFGKVTAFRIALTYLAYRYVQY